MILTRCAWGVQNPSDLGSEPWTYWQEFTVDSLFYKLSYVPQVLRLMTTRYVNKFSLAAKHNHS